MHGGVWRVVVVLVVACTLCHAGYNPDEVHYKLPSGRDYYVSNPKGIASSGEKAPILLFLHGLNCACQNADETTHLITALATHNFKALVVSACGANAQWDVFGSSSSDIPFLQAVLADVATKYNVDTNKVFAEGFSMGGMMVSVAGCALGTKIFSLGFSMNGCGIQCGSLSGPVHVLGVEGKQDSVCPYTHQLSSYNSWKTFARQESCAEQSKLDTSVQTCQGMEVDFYYVDGPHAVIESSSFSGSNKSVEFMLARLNALPPAVNTCATNNGGCGDVATTTCAAGATAVTCTCKPGFAGNPPTTQCAPAADPCASVDCGAHGRCSNGACTCSDGFTGPTCAIPPTATCFFTVQVGTAGEYYLDFNLQTTKPVATVSVQSGGQTVAASGPFNWGSNKPAVYQLNGHLTLPVTFTVTASDGSSGKAVLTSFTAGNLSC